MRIFLLPLTTRQALVFCQRITPKPTSQRSILDKVNQKATDTWAKWEKAEKGWQKQVVTYGNRALQRIPYQEWALKSFPPTNPNLQAEHITEEKKFEVVYPGNIMQQEDIPKVLGRLARERKQLHFNRFIGSMVGMPFTVPFALVPIVPNLPFFYLLYRCWSHWRALKGSDHLDFILDHRLFKTVSTPAIEGIYEQYAPYLQQSFEFVTRAQIEEGTAQKEKSLIPAGAHNAIATSLEALELSGEIERAVWQIERATKQEEKEREQKRASASSREVVADEKHEERK